MSYRGIFDLSGKTAVVTGARKGIGFAMASILAEFGANIIAVSSKQEADDDLKKVVTSFGVEFSAVACDLRERSETKSLISTLKDSKIDILVNNAGIASRGVVLEHTDEQWDQTIEIDLNAPFFLSREFARGMAARGSGKIIFTASMWTVPRWEKCY